MYIQLSLDGCTRVSAVALRPAHLNERNREGYVTYICILFFTFI